MEKTIKSSTSTIVEEATVSGKTVTFNTRTEQNGENINKNVSASIQVDGKMVNISASNFNGQTTTSVTVGAGLDRTALKTVINNVTDECINILNSVENE